MGVFDRKTLAENDVPAAMDLFSRIVAAEAGLLTDEQKANPRAYLIGTWREAAEAIIRPLQRVEDMAEDLRRQREEAAAMPDDWVSKMEIY